MCLGTVALVTAMGSGSYVEIRSGGRDLEASMLAVGDHVEPGDWVLVHSGLVLARLTEQEARVALDLRDPNREAVR